MLRLSLIRIIIVFLIVVTSVILLSLLHDGYVRREYKLLDIITILSSVMVTFGIAFLAILQPEFIRKTALMEMRPSDETENPPVYAKHRLGHTVEKEHAEKLINIMLEMKPYLDEDITLNDLAALNSITPHQLSMILNLHIKMNFFTFINSYRVDEAKRLLSDPENRDAGILSIAFSSGFNSKSTFNTMFKKFTGITPKEYRAHSLRKTEI